MDEKKLVKFKIDAIGLDLEISPLDLICLAGAAVMVGIYIYTKNWIYNNILATMVSINGIQMIFLGNFTNGFIMLIALFFYDIFFVFGTNVMLTVAKSIDAPIKLLFPTDWSSEPPKFTLLGLGDIVIPGIFIAMCLRFDILKSLNAARVNMLCEKGNPDEVLSMLKKAAYKAPKTYFYTCLVGYVLAIGTTIVIMLVFEHG